MCSVCAVCVQCVCSVCNLQPNLPTQLAATLSWASTFYKLVSQSSQCHHVCRDVQKQQMQKHNLIHVHHECPKSINIEFEHFSITTYLVNSYFY